MQTLKFKISHEFKDEITAYQKQYSSMLHFCFEYLKNEEKLDSLFNYEKGTSKLIQMIKSLNNLNMLISWFIQCCVNEAYQLVNSFKLKQNEYKQKVERRIELQSKDKLLKAEKKELKKLSKIKEPKLIFRWENVVQ